jgi:hypothetical protein
MDIALRLPRVDFQSHASLLQHAKGPGLAAAQLILEGRPGDCIRPAAVCKGGGASKSLVITPGASNEGSSRARPLCRTTCRAAGDGAICAVSTAPS